MKKLIEEAENNGTEILDKETGNFIKKMPCGFYPTCVDSLGKDSMVIGGKLIFPKERRNGDKMVYICKEHQADVKSADTGKEGINEE